MYTIRKCIRGSLLNRVALPLFLVAAASAPLFAQTPSLADRLPASTVFFAQWHGLASVTNAEKTNHVVQLFEDPQFAKTRQSLVRNLRNSIAKNGPATSEPELAEVVSLFDSPAVLGIMLNPAADPKPAAKGSTSPPLLGFFVVYDARENSTLVEKLRAANRASGKEVPTVLSYEFEGVKIEARATGTDVSYTALTPKFYFFADQKSVIELLISRYDAPGAPATSVTQLPEYQQARAYMLPGAAVDFFARVPDLSKILTPEQSHKPAATAAETLHLDRVRLFGASVSFSGEAVRFRGAILGDTSAGTLFDIAGASSPSFATFPVVSTGPAFSVSRYDFSAGYKTLRAGVQAALTPQQTALLTMYEQMGQVFLGMPVSDALELFTGEVASQTTFADDGASEKIYALSIQNPHAVLGVVHALGKKFITSEDVDGDTTYLDISLPQTDSRAGAPKNTPYYVAIAPNVIVGGLTKASVRAAVERMAAKSPAPPQTGVFASADYQHVRSLFPAKLTGLSAADIAAIPWDKVIAHAERQAADAAKTSGTDTHSLVDWFQTVQPDVLTKHLHVGINGWWKDSNGIYFDSYLQ